MQHLNAGIDKTVQLIAKVRKAAQDAQQMVAEAEGAGVGSGTTFQQATSAALDKVEKIEGQNLPKLHKMASRQFLATTDDGIKCALKELAPIFEDLQRSNVALQALVKVPKVKKEKKK